MWAFKEREKRIFKKMFPSEYFDRTVQCPNGGEVTVEELFKRGRISGSEVQALYKSLPEDVEFHKFIDCLRPRKNQESEETMTEDQKKAKQAYRQRIQKLKEKQANKEYAEMTKSIDRARDQPLLQNFGQELRAANRQMIAVANTLITVGGAFAFGFWGIHFAYPHLRLDIAERMLLGLVFGTIVFFADLYFLVKGMDQDGKLI